MYLSLENIVRVSALAACALVVAMVSIFLSTGVGQDPLQFVHPPVEYARILLANPAALRATIALDNFFIVFYSTVFIALGALLWRGGAEKPVVALAIGLLLVLGLLDMIENFHFMVMLANAEQGVLPSTSEISFQVWESLLKFHGSYLGLFLLGLALPRDRSRALANLSIFVQLPVGVLIYVVPRALAVPLVFARFTYFVVALLLLAKMFGAQRGGGSGALVSHPDTTPGVAG